MHWGTEADGVHAAHASARLVHGNVNVQPNPRKMCIRVARHQLFNRRTTRFGQACSMCVRYLQSKEVTMA